MTRNSPTQLAWQRFKKNKLALVGLIFLGLCVLVGIFGYVLAPDSTRNGNFQVIELAKRPPGTQAHFLLKPRPVAEDRESWLGRVFIGKTDRFQPVPITEGSIRLQNDTLHYLDHLGLEQYFLLPDFLYIIDPTHPQTLAWKAEFGKPYSIENGQVKLFEEGGGEVTFEAEAKWAEARAEHTRQFTYLLGSDGYGRDVLSRLILGTRVSLSVGLLAVLVSLFVGITLGSLAGFFRGKVDAVIMWFVSVVWSIPTLLLAISITFAFEKGFWQVFMAIGLSMWVEVARIVRGQIFSLREMLYVEATRALGFGPARAIVRHILPNILSPVIIIAAANFAAAILIEAGLSFLGVGVQPPMPSWGSMIREGYTNIIFESGKFLAIFPGLAIVLVVISLNLVGFGLRDALDPKSRS